MADQGATVVVNDLGVDVSGEGSDSGPAEETVERIEEADGEAVAHFGDVTDFEYTKRLIAETHEQFGSSAGSTPWRTSRACCATGCRST
jgi:hypothetical protein